MGLRNKLNMLQNRIKHYSLYLIFLAGGGVHEEHNHFDPKRSN